MPREKKSSIAAKALSKLGAARGGKARALSLTSEQRSQMARKAVIARWAKEKGVSIDMIAKKTDQPLKALKQGVLKIGAKMLPVAVLNDGTRVITMSGVFNAFGRTVRSKINVGNRVINMPSFIDAQNLQPFITEAVQRVINQITYINLSGKETKGYNALIIPYVCDVYLNARDAKVLTKKQLPVATASDIIVRGLSKVGIVALVDEATGYQKQKDNYQKLLEQYIAPEIRPWVKTFDEDYYKQLYRLIGWNWDAFKAKKKNHSQYIGRLTNRIIYEKLAPGILEALDELNPKNEHGNRSHKHHQNLSENIGYIKLIKHLSAVTTIMEQFDDGQIVEALHQIDSRYPSLKLDYQMSFNFPIPMKPKQIEAKN